MFRQMYVVINRFVDYTEFTVDLMHLVLINRFDTAPSNRKMRKFVKSEIEQFRLRYPVYVSTPHSLIGRFS